MRGNSTPVTSALAWIAGGIAFLVAVSLPLGYFALSYQHLMGAVSTEAQFNAKYVAEHIGLHPGHWRLRQVDLVRFLVEDDRTRAEYPERRRILGPDGAEVVSSDAAALPSPTLSRRAPVFADGKVAAYYEVSRTFRPLVLDTVLVALLGLALAIAVFSALKLLPLRALNRVLERLRQSEELFSKAFHASPDPIMVCRIDDGRVIHVNQAFCRLSGYKPHEVVERSRDDLALWAGDDDTRRALQQLREARAAQNLEMVLVARDGGRRDMLVSSEKTTINDEPCVLTVARDVTEQKRAEHRMAYLANFDHLTGLPNRTLFRDRLLGAMQRARRAERLVALLYLDLDRFKQVNDSLGHQVGDALLMQVADRLQGCVRSTDSVAHARPQEAALANTVARLGGDEFTVVLEGIKHIDEITLIAQRIIEGVAAPFDLEGRQVYVGASIGITIYPFDDVDLDNLVRNADAAMYRAKALGRNNFQFYTDDLNANAEARLWLDAELRKALEREQFELHYQPKLNLRTNTIEGVEALLRWRSPTKGVVSPLEFIPLLEETGLIVAVGAWVLRTACEQAAAWARAGLTMNMAVNLSARQFNAHDLVDQIESALGDTGLAPQRLELEVTESLLMEDSAASQATLNRIKGMGVRISVDDFGTGYSSLAYLKRFPLDTLKIDRAFVKELGVSADDTAIVRAVIALARNLRLTVVAEGVETSEQLAFLRDSLCEQAQGYLISRPMDAEALEAWLAEHHAGQRPITQGLRQAADFHAPA